VSRTGSRLVASVLLLCALAGCGGSGDAEVIDELRAAGADLSQAREVRYYLYLPTEEAANDVADRVADGNRAIEVSPAATGSDWLVLITEVAIVDEATMAARRDEFESAVADAGGEYDGWEAAVDP
jgi:regulator of ribonuclease activity B